MRQLKITQQITNRESISMTKYLQDVSAIPLLTDEEEQTLPLKIQQGDQAALHRFVSGNLRFVISVAKQYQNSDRLDDLINIGNEGLIKAAKRFDTTKGFKFISYAVWWIRQSIMEHISGNNKGIRLPANKTSLLNKIRNTSARLEQKLNRLPTSEEILEELQLDPKTQDKFSKLEPVDIDVMLSLNAPMTSLDMPVSEDNETPIIDLLVNSDMGNMQGSMNRADLNIVLKKVFEQRLSPREKEVLESVFGLFDSRQKTLEEIGVDLDLTRERVRQIKEKAIRRLKNSTVSKEIREYL